MYMHLDFACSKVRALRNKAIKKQSQGSTWCSHHSLAFLVEQQHLDSCAASLKPIVGPSMPKEL